MRHLTICFITVFLPVCAQAHVGHLGEFAGHDHVVAGVAIGIAIALGLREALKGKTDAEDRDEPEAEPEPSA